jgi:hypothetical protein
MTTVSESLPHAGCDMPDADQLARLLEIVTSDYRQFKGAFSDDEFRRAFWVCRTLFRRPSLNTSCYWNHWADVANEKLVRVELAPIGGPALLAACLAHGDILVQWPDSSVGALLEVGLDEYSGRRATNVWLDLHRWRARLDAPPSNAIVASSRSKGCS